MFGLLIQDERTARSCQAAREREGERGRERGGERERGKEREIYILRGRGQNESPKSAQSAKFSQPASSCFLPLSLNLYEFYRKCEGRTLPNCSHISSSCAYKGE